MISHMGALLSLNNSIRVQRGRNLMTKRTRPRLLLGVLREEIKSATAAVSGCLMALREVCID